jgi:hypothetical protein
MDKAATDVIKSAANSSWEAGVLVIVLLSAMALLAFIVKWLIKNASEREKDRLQAANDREKALNTTIENQQVFIRDKLITALLASVEGLKASAVVTEKQNETSIKLTEAVTKMAQGVELRPCLLSHDKQMELIDALIDRFSELIEKAKK